MSLGALNDHLFAQLDRLSNPELPDEELKHEVTRTDAMDIIAKSAISNAALALKAEEMKVEYGRTNMPKMLQVGSNGSNK